MMGLTGILVLLVKMVNESDKKRVIALSTALHSNQCVVVLFNGNAEIINSILVFTIQHSICSAA